MKKKPFLNNFEKSLRDVLGSKKTAHKLSLEKRLFLQNMAKNPLVFLPETHLKNCEKADGEALLLLREKLNKLILG